MAMQKKNSHRGPAYRCVSCRFADDRRGIIKHIVTTHRKTADAPYFCLACEARFVNQRLWKRHGASAGHRGRLWLFEQEVGPSQVTKAMGQNPGKPVRLEGVDREATALPTETSKGLWEKISNGGMVPEQDDSDEEYVEEDVLDLEPSAGWHLGCSSDEEDGAFGVMKKMFQQRSQKPGGSSSMGGAPKTTLGNLLDPVHEDDLAEEVIIEETPQDSSAVPAPQGVGVLGTPAAAHSAAQVLVSSQPVGTGDAVVPLTVAPTEEPPSVPKEGQRDTAPEHCPPTHPS